MAEKLSKFERKAAMSLSSIYAFRMLGLFMILPVFAPYGSTLKHSTPFLIGLALGIYGLSQALLQIPFGHLSDKFGRKPIIFLGLILFIIGSIVAAVSTSIDGVIIGRLLQGAGAVGSSLNAFLSDLTREEVRTKGMAMIGMTIAMSFFIAIILGPALASWMGVNGLFWLTAALGLIGIVMLFTTVPSPKKQVFHYESGVDASQAKRSLRNPELWRLNIGIFLSHAILTSMFLALPFVFLNDIDVALKEQWVVYLPILIIAFICIFPMIIMSEVKRKLKQFLILSILFLGLSQLGLYFAGHSGLFVAICLFIFFTAFSFLEATLPSLVSKIAPAGNKGTAMGIYSSCQFLGIFAGGLLGGWLLQHHDVTGIFLLTLILAAIWLLVALLMKEPPYLSTKIIHIGTLNAGQIETLKAQLLSIPGVKEVALMLGDESAYLKVDKKLLDAEALNALQKKEI